MKARCPDDPTHDRFFTVAHVMEQWEVDEEGNFIGWECTLETTHKPDPDNIWTCAVCGKEAVVTR